MNTTFPKGATVAYLGPLAKLNGITGTILGADEKGWIIADFDGHGEGKYAPAHLMKYADHPVDSITIPSPVQNLYHVCSGEGYENHDLVVRAPDIDDAVRFWREHWSFAPDDMPDNAWLIPGGAASGAIPWTQIECRDFTAEPLT